MLISLAPHLLAPEDVRPGGDNDGAARVTRLDA
jgi:hypothetical protein